MGDLSTEPHGDLVGWLRRRADYSGYGTVFKNAADEIERLRNALNLIALTKHDEATDKDRICQFARDTLKPQRIGPS